MKFHNITRRLGASLSAFLLAGSMAAVAAVSSGNPALSELEIRANGTNLINFNQATTTYNIELEDASMITLSAAPVASDATVSITVNGKSYDNHSLSALDGGDNTIVYTVTTGGQSRTYTINIKTPQVIRDRVFNWRNATVYFVMTDRFYNGDTSNDNSYHRKRNSQYDMATFHGGDLKGLTQKLDYLDKLGIDAIWISAPYEQMHGWTGGADDKFPHYAFHGYYALDWTYMDRNMGTIQDMKNFVTEAHKRGIRVLMDVVINHTGYCTLDDMMDYGWGAWTGSAQAGWMPSNAPYSFWNDGSAVKFDVSVPGGSDKWKGWWGDWVRAFGDRDEFRQAVGFAKPGGDDLTMSLAGLPDLVSEKTSAVSLPPFLKKKWQQEASGDFLNYRLPNLDGWRVDSKGAPLDYVINWLAGWVEYFGIDGFRCDTAKHIEKSRWSQLKNACNQALANWRASDRADEYAKGWTDGFWMTGECFGWQHGDTSYFTEGKFDSMINFAFNSQSGSTGRTPTEADWEYYANFCNRSGGHQVLSYISSHDTGLHRPGDQKKVGTMFLLNPGGIQIFYGDETERQNMSGDFGSDKDMKTRGDFNWDAVDNEVNKHWQKLGQFRRRNLAVGAGTQVNLGDGTYGRKFNEGGVSNAVVIKLNTTAGQSYTVSVGDCFAEGAKVMDGYNTQTTATVQGGKVTIAASGPVLLLEPFGTIIDQPLPPTPPTPQAPTVTADPASGTTFSSTLSVKLSSSDNSSIYYSTTGAATASSTLYTAPITLDKTTTIHTFVSNANGSRNQEFTYTKTDEPTPPTPGVDHYVYYDGTFSNPAVWAWNDTESCTSAGSWPGDKMTKKDGKWYWALPSGKSVPTQIIISENGGEKIGGGNLSYVDKATYHQNGTYSQGDDPTPPTPPTPGDVKVYYKGSWNPVNVYIYKPGNGSSVEKNAEWPGAQMTKVSGKDYWSYTVPANLKSGAKVIFNNGTDQYPQDQPGQSCGLDLNGKSMMYDGNTSWTEFSEGPQKPSITINPNGGTVKGNATITVTIGNDATSVSGTFNGKTLSLSNTGGSFTVSNFLNEGASGQFSVTATNSLGSTQASCTFTRDDTTPVYSLTGDWRELSIYQIMVGSFQHGNGGASGYSDMWGPEGHRKNGNLRGIIDALDYIKDLGMNAIWMTPVFDSTNGQGGEKLQATGYFCTNYFKIDPKFGTEAEFDELIRKAHEKGIYVILDGVFGHHGGVNSASPNGKRIESGDNVQNVRGSESGNIRFPGSLDYFKEVVRYWMNKGVDGWRLDQCYQVYQGGHNYWNDLRREVEAVCNERKARGEQWGTLGYMVGEDWTSAGNITVTQQDGLKSVMDFDGKDNLVGLGYGVGSIGWLLASDAATRGYRDSGVNPTLFLSNHDTARVGDFVDVNSKPKELMTRHAAVAAYSGPTCTYYGDEIGDKSGNGNPDNKARTSGRISNFNQNEQMVHDYVAKVFKARAANPALWRGTAERKQVGNNCEVIIKTDSQTGNKVVCIFSQTDTNYNIGGNGTDLINGGTVSGTVNVKAWEPAFIKMN